MASEWTTLPVGEVAAVRSGYAFKSSDWTASGIPVVKIANVKDGRLEMAGCSFVDEEVARAAGDYRLSDGDILIAMTGYVGDVARVRYTDLPCVLNQRVGKFTVLNSKWLDANYLFQFLASADTRQTIAGLGYGSAQPNVSPSLIHKVEIPLPPLPEQKRIAHVLGTLDDKIELNRRMNATLEAMSRAIFKSWFVDFDPVRQKAAGKQPVGMDAETAALFPDSFEDSELGEVPTGWEHREASDLYEITIGKTPPRKEKQWFSLSPDDVPWMSIKDLGAAGVFIGEVSEYLTAEAVESFRVKRIPEGTVVLSFKLTVGRVSITEREMLSNEAIAHFLDKKQSLLSSEFLFCYLKQFDFDRLGSTSSIATAVNSKTIRAMPLLLPSQSIVGAFGSRVRDNFKKIRLIQQQSRTLAALRDTLLPKLLSGEIRVPEAEEAVEEAVG